jgi:hypothetical protein
MDNTISDNNKQWLQANYNIWERHRVGNFKHIDREEAKRFQSIAKEIDDDRYFSIYSCDKCIQELVRFVFTQYDKENGKSIEVKGSEEVSKGISTAKRKSRKELKSSV